MLNAIKTIPNQCNTLVFFPSEGSSLLYVFTEKMKYVFFTLAGFTPRNKTRNQTLILNSVIHM